MADKTPRKRRYGRPDARKVKASQLYAAVDLGTNNCRLLVAEPRGQTFRVVDSHSQIARLGEGLHETGRLSEDAIERAIDALKAIRAKLKQNGVGRTRCIATEACRKAENGPEFIRRVHDEIGLTFKIISAKEEARLATIGCHDLIAPDATSVLVVDIGGGSTELSWVNGKQAVANGFKAMVARAPIQGWASLPVGVVTLSEAFEHLDDETECFNAMRDYAREKFSSWKQIDDVKAALMSEQAHMIGTSGTVTCLAGVHLGLERYRRDKVDGTWLSRDETFDVTERLRVAGLAGRAKFPTIGEERAPLMLAGCAIVQGLWDVFPCQRMRVGDRGLREGLLLSMIYGPKKTRSRRGRRGKQAEPDTPIQSDPDDGATA